MANLLLPCPASGIQYTNADRVVGKVSVPDEDMHTIKWSLTAYVDKCAAAQGFGLQVDPSQIGAPAFEAAIVGVLINPKYTQAAQAGSIGSGRAGARRCRRLQVRGHCCNRCSMHVEIYASHPADHAAGLQGRECLSMVSSACVHADWIGACAGDGLQGLPALVDG